MSDLSKYRESVKSSLVVGCANAEYSKTLKRLSSHVGEDSENVRFRNLFEEIVEEQLYRAFETLGSHYSRTTCPTFRSLLRSPSPHLLPLESVGYMRIFDFPAPPLGTFIRNSQRSMLPFKLLSLVLFHRQRMERLYDLFKLTNFASQIGKYANYRVTRQTAQAVTVGEFIRQLVFIGDRRRNDLLRLGD